MSIDVSQFHQVFFEESAEGLDAMEMGLLGMQQGLDDVETINTIFRAAHSIKGGAGSFGFGQIAEFTHGLETLLDQMRNGERELSQQALNTLLQAVDVLRGMLAAAQRGDDIDQASAEIVRLEIEALLHSALPAAETPGLIDEPKSPQNAGWSIYFKPHRHLLQTGNDPVLMLRELAELGELSVEINTDSLPGFCDLEPEDCYLAWHIEIHGDTTLAQLKEIFEWVEGDCELEITPLSNTTVAVSDPLSVEEADSASTMALPAADAVVKKDRADSAVSSIRVGTEKVDSLINLVGELVITQSMLSQLGENFEISRLPQLIDGIEQLERNTRELQEGIMRIRMLPISFAFNRLPRLVYDLSAKMGKQVELSISGEQTELDKTVMEKIGDPLVHLVRNALDHGLETPAQRRAAGKPETGLLHLNAYHQGGTIVIEISDDGAGLDQEKIRSKAIERGLISSEESLSQEEVHELIFMPGFSTAEEVSDVSGRGVGMDVVRKNIHGLGGSVDVSSGVGVGSSFIIRLPLTLAIMDGQIIQVGDQRYIIPLISVIETVEIMPGTVKKVAGKGEVYSLRDEYVPVLRLYQLFNLTPISNNLENALLVVVEFEDQRVGLLVDALQAQQQVVIRSLEKNYRKVTGIAGATILGDGDVALILDISGLLTLYRDPSQRDANKTFRAA